MTAPWGRDSSCPALPNDHRPPGSAQPIAHTARHGTQHTSPPIDMKPITQQPVMLPVRFHSFFFLVPITSVHCDGKEKEKQLRGNVQNISPGNDSPERRLL